MKFVRSGANNVKYSWNKVVKDFLESDSDYLFSCHNDVVFLPDTLPRLMSWNLPLVSALVFHRQSPQLPHIWSGENHERPYWQNITETREWFVNRLSDIQPGAHIIEPRPDDALTEVDFTSTSCTLIHRSVLEAMREEVKDQWFVWDDDYAGGGEDRNFFEHAKLAGYQAYVDRSVIVGHLMGDVATGSMDFMMWTQSSTFKGIESE
jgi:GT2 family glycosyltransferase